MMQAAVFLLIGWLIGVSAVKDSRAASMPECVMNSQNPAPIIDSAPCGLYGIVNTRQANGVGNDLDVTVQYMVHLPMGAPRALVMLFSGGTGATGIMPNGSGGVAQAGSNFLVRSAQLFAELGFLAVTIDRPSDTVGFTNADFDHYRVSPAHAQDIATVLAAVNRRYGTEHLDIFLAGTSRGALSITAQNMLGIGSMLSNPVTAPSGNPANLWVGSTSNHARLKPDFVAVPVQVLVHRDDGCAVTQPADAAALHNDFLAAGVSSVLNGLVGGFELDPDGCNALTYHGFLGIERSAVRSIARRVGEILQNLKSTFPGNLKPKAFNAKLATSADTPLTINLDSLSYDPDGDPLRFTLPHDFSSRGGALQLRGSWLRYWPPRGATQIVDGLVFRVTDGKGGVSTAVIRVKVNEAQGEW